MLVDAVLSLFNFFFHARWYIFTYVLQKKENKIRESDQIKLYSQILHRFPKNAYSCWQRTVFHLEHERNLAPDLIISTSLWLTQWEFPFFFLRYCNDFFFSLSGESKWRDLALLNDLIYSVSFCSQSPLCPQASTVNSVNCLCNRRTPF